MKPTHKTIVLICTMGALALCFCFLCSCALLRQEPSPATLNEGMVEWVNARDTLEPAAVVAGMRSLAQSREDVIRSREAAAQSAHDASVAESASIEASIAESIALESRRAASINESEYQAQSLAKSIAASKAAEKRASIAASSSWEAMLASVKESIYSGGTPTGKLTAGKVFTVGDEAVPEIRRLFADTVIIGHSGARNILDSGVLTEDVVLYKWAAHMDEIGYLVDQGAQLYRSKVLFIMGTNDLGYYCERVDDWKADYEYMIRRFLEINPTAKVYLQEIADIPEDYHYRWNNWFRVDDYNAAIRELCADNGWTMVTANDFTFPEFLADETGTHYNKKYHFYWAQTIANQMGLWDAAGGKKK